MAASVTSKLPTFPTKPRVIVLSDISNEPDDAESLVRYLTYANQFETEGLVAVTSTWLRDRVRPEEMLKIIDQYEKVVDNLNAHVHPDWKYPSAQELRAVVKRGAEAYGMSALADDIPLSEGAQFLFERIEAPDTRPLWILCWGGTSDLAAALLKLDDKHAPEDSARLRSRLRIYAISDQDDSSLWIRTNFPDIFYIVSVHGWNQYGLAAWTGISGDEYYGFDQGGPDFSKWSRAWLKKNIQLGPLGEAYPDYKYIPEGDTPSFLYLIQNGLGNSEHPEYGSWGGRYIKTDPSPDGLVGHHYSDAVDRVVGADGKTYTSNHATIWRWRDAFQNDFAARIQWSLTSDFAKANHHPVIWLNETTGVEPVKLDAEAGSLVTLDASKTFDPDGDKLTFKWFHYREPSATTWLVEREVGTLEIRKLDPEGRRVEVKVPEKERYRFSVVMDRRQKRQVANGPVLHLVLEVSDDGTPPLTSYRRVLLQVTNNAIVPPPPQPAGPGVPLPVIGNGSKRV